MNKQNDFKNYLQNENYSDGTIHQHIVNVRHLEAWRKENDVVNEALNYNELLSYVNHLQSQQLKPHTINIRLHSISVYYEYLKKYDYITKNTATSIRVQNTAKTVITDVLNIEELQNLYHDYVQLKNNTLPKNTTEEHHHYTKNKYIVQLGLLIYQALHTGELSQLQVKDIDLDKGVIYVNGNNRINARILKLEPIQILPISNYLNMLKTKTEQLFKENPRSSVSAIIQELKGLDPKIQNAYQLRASVIMHWLKIHDKRKTQYLIGHKYISSTEKYEEQNVDGLMDLLKKYHPFG
jgi:site-specific recombinase XerD